MARTERCYAIHDDERDRPRGILAALALVQPDGIVHFAPGTYLVGELIRVTVPGVTLQGHPDGTTLRGRLGPPPAWREANGAGVWISPGSDENEIVGNTFAV